MWHQIVGFSLRKALPDSTLNPDKASAELVFSKFPDRSNTAITKVINVVWARRWVCIQFSYLRNNMNEIGKSKGAFLESLFSSWKTEASV